MYEYDPFPDKRWEQKVARALLKYIDSGGEELPTKEWVINNVPQNRRSSFQHSDGQNLTHLGKVIATLTGLLTIKQLKEFYIYGLKDLSSFEGNSESYSNYQLIPALAAKFGLDKQLDYEPTKYIRRKLAWYILHTTPNRMDVYSCNGRDTEREPFEPLREIIRVIFGKPPIRSYGDDFWKRHYVYSAQVFLRENNLIPSIYTIREIQAFSSFRLDRVISQSLRNILADIYAPSNVTWNTYFYPNNRYIATVDGLRTYIEGKNGVTVYVDMINDNNLDIRWFNRHADSIVLNKSIRIIDHQTGNVEYIPFPPGYIHFITVNNEGTFINGVKLAQRTFPNTLPPKLKNWGISHIRNGMSNDEIPDEGINDELLHQVEIIENASNKIRSLLT